MPGNIKCGVLIADDKVNFPENFTIEGNLELTTKKVPPMLPEGLTVTGNLTLKGYENLKTLPENLKVHGQLDLSKCRDLGKESLAARTKVLEQLAEMERKMGPEFSILYPPHLAKSELLLQELLKCIKDSLGLENDGDAKKKNIYQFCFMFLTQNLDKRGGNAVVSKAMMGFIRFFEKKDADGNYVNRHHMVWIEKMAKDFNKNCVNQRVSGFMEIDSIINIIRAKQAAEERASEDTSESLSPLKAAIDASSEYITLSKVKEYLSTMSSIKSGPGIAFEVEAANLLMIKLKKKLIEKNFIATNAWPSIPESIAHAGSVKEWVEKHLNAIYAQVLEALDRTHKREFFLETSTTAYLAYAEYLDPILFPAAVKEKEKYIQKENIALKKEVLQHLMSFNEDLEGEKQGFYVSQADLREARCDPEKLVNLKQGALNMLIEDINEGRDAMRKASSISEHNKKPPLTKDEKTSIEKYFYALFDSFEEWEPDAESKLEKTPNNFVRASIKSLDEMVQEIFKSRKALAFDRAFPEETSQKKAVANGAPLVTKGY